MALRFVSIFFGSLFEAKTNLNNCYYLTEAHATSNSNDTTRDLNEEELILLGEFYDTYDRPLANIEDSSSMFESSNPRFDSNSTPGGPGPSNNLPSEEDAILRTHRNEEI